MEQRPDLLAIYRNQLEELWPQYRRKALSAVAISAIALTALGGLDWQLLLHPGHLPFAANISSTASRGSFLIPLLGLGVVVGLAYRLFAPVRITPALQASGLAERLAAGLLTADPILEQPRPAGIAPLPGMAADDYRGQAARLCQWLSWYLRPPGPLTASPEQSWRFGAIAVAAGALLMVFLSPFHGYLAASFGAMLVCTAPLNDCANCAMLAAYLAATPVGATGPDAAPGATALAAPSTALTDSVAAAERQHRMALELNVAEKSVKEITRNFSEQILAMLAVLAVASCLLFKLVSPLALLALAPIAGGYALARRGRRAYRSKIRQELRASDLAVRIVTGELDFAGLRQAALPGTAFSLRLLDRPGRAELQRTLLLVALNCDWFVHPRPNYALPPASLLWRMLFYLLAGFGLPALLQDALPESWLQTVRNLYPHSYVPLLLPVILGYFAVLGLALAGDAAEARTAIAAEEFIAYLRERLTA